MQQVDRQFSRVDTAKVKGFAIIIMVIHHSFLSPERYTGQTVIFAPFSEHVFNWIAYAFKICVAIFTFLSAYGITLSFKKQYPSFRFSGVNAGKIIVKRLISLLGGYFFIYLLAVFYGEVFVRKGRFLATYGEGKRGILYCLIDALGLAEFFSTPTYLATFWYMSLAIALILLMPLLLKIYRNVGSVSFLGMALLFRVLFPVTPEHHMVYLPNYLMCICLGIVAADRNLIVKMQKQRYVRSALWNHGLKIAIELFLLAMFLIVRQKTRNTVMMPLMDSLIPLLICHLMFDYFNRVPLLERILYVFGKYSMNMFLIHNFIRVVWYYDFTYHFRYWWLITIVLLSISLILSIIIEWVKEKIRYNQALEILKKKLTGES